MRALTEETKKKLTAIDLFSGCGGLSLGLKKAGYNVLAAVEIDRKAQETYQLNHPEVMLVSKDIKKIPAAQLMRELNLRPGALDLLAGCPPCQGFSRMRTKNKKPAVMDERNELIFDFLRFVKAFKPKAVMLENVPSLKDDKRFMTFVLKLERLGYRGRPEVQNACDYGVPQSRRRLIYLGTKIPLALPELKKNVELVTVRDAIGWLPPPGKTKDDIHEMSERRSEKTKRIIEAIPKNGGSRSALPKKYQLNCHSAFDGFRDVYGRMKWSEPAPTITGGCHNPSKGRFIHPTQNRAITLREAALLQGFPVGYKFIAEHGKEAIALMIGNALPPPFISAHAKAVAKVIITKKKKREQ